MRKTSDSFYKNGSKNLASLFIIPSVKTLIFIYCMSCSEIYIHNSFAKSIVNNEDFKARTISKEINLLNNSSQNIYPDLYVSIGYQGRFFGIPVMKTRYQLAFYNQQYSAYSHFSTAGIMAWFKKADIRSKTYGSIESASVQPDLYEHKNHASKKNRIVRIHFKHNQVLPDIHPPFGSQGIIKPTKEQLSNSIDPLSASVLLAIEDSQNICKTKYTIFDRKLLYNLILENKGDAYVKTPTYKGKTIKCHIFYEPIAGFDREDLPKIDISNKPATIWIAKFDINVNNIKRQIHIPVKISFRIKGWKGSIEAKSLSFK